MISYVYFITIKKMRKDKEMHISVYVYVCGGRGE